MSTNLCYPCPCLSSPRTISTPAPGQPRQLGGAVRLLLLDPVLVSIQCREISDRGDLGRGHSGHCPAFIIHGPASGGERRQCCVNTGHCGGWAEVTRVWCSRDTGDSCSGSMHSGRNQGFLSNGCIGCIYLVKILAHCAMLQCMSRYNKPP